MPNSQSLPTPDKASSRSTQAKRPAPKKRADRRLSKEELSRHEREVRAVRLIVGAVVAVAVVVVAVLGFGWWREYVARSSEAVASVAGHSITLESFARRLDLNRKNTQQQMAYMQTQLQANSSNDSVAGLLRQQIQQLQFTLMLIPDQTLSQMIDEEIVRQEAARRGLTVSSDEIAQETNKTFGDPPTPEPAPSPTSGPAAAGPATTDPSPSPTAEPAPSPAPTADVQARLNSALSLYGATIDDYNALVEAQLLTDKLQSALATEVPTSAEQVHARHILVDSEDKAKEIVVKLKDGTNFEDLAKAETKDPSTQDKGGDLGWFTSGTMVPEFDTVAFQLSPGQTSDPVQTSFGWHVIQVLEKDPNRALDDRQLSGVKSEALSRWLQQARTSPDIKSDLDDQRRNWVYQRIKWSPPSP